MVEGRWRNRTEAAVDLTKRANDISWCFCNSVHFAKTFKFFSATTNGNQYSRHLYLFLGKIEHELKALGIEYPRQIKNAKSTV